MIIEGEAILLSLQPFRSSKHLCRCFFKEYGMRSGILRGKLLPLHGTRVHATWQGRLEEQLGSLKVEPERTIANIFDKASLLVCNSVISLLCTSLNPHQPELELFQAARAAIPYYEVPKRVLLMNYVLFEIQLIKFLGYTLELSRCALTGRRTNLKYISPKTGCVVSEEVGRQYKNKLFQLPDYWLKMASANDVEPTNEDILSSFRITSHFLEKALFKGETKRASMQERSNSPKQDIMI